MCCWQKRWAAAAGALSTAGCGQRVPGTAAHGCAALGDGSPQPQAGFLPRGTFQALDKDQSGMFSPAIAPWGEHRDCGTSSAPAAKPDRPLATGPSPGSAVPSVTRATCSAQLIGAALRGPQGMRFPGENPVELMPQGGDAGGGEDTALLPSSLWIYESDGVGSPASAHRATNLLRDTDCTSN